MVNFQRWLGGQTRRVTTGAALLLALGVGGFAFAQKAPPGTGGMQFRMSDALTQAQQYMSAIDAAVVDANTALGQLEEDGKMSKLEEARIAMKQLERLVSMAGKAYDALQQAAAQSNAARGEREFVKVTVAYQRILDIVARIKAAAGNTQTSTVDGSPEIDLIKDADLPTSDPGEDIGLINTLEVDTGRPPATTPIN